MNRKKFLSCILSAVFALLGSSAVFGGEAIITGYGPREFAVKGELQRQLDSLADSLKQEASEASNEDSVLKLYLEGGADKTGDAGRNDDYGFSRAKSAEAYLSFRLPNVIVKSWSAGNAPDARQIKVRWEWIKSAPAQPQIIERVIEREVPVQVIVPARTIEPEPKTEPTPAPRSEWTDTQMYIGFGLLGCLLLVFFLLFPWRRKKERAEIAGAKADTYPETWPKEIPGIAKMFCERLHSNDFGACAFCGRQVSGKRYVHHLIKQCSPSPFAGRDDKAVRDELRKEHTDAQRYAAA